MADLPDYYTQAQISEAEAAKFKGGLDANKSATPVSRDVYLATDTQILYVCIADGVWTGFDASILTQGILTLYENLDANSKKIIGLGAPAVQDDALRYGRAEIRNAEIAALAAIAYSKLNLTGAIKAADIAVAAGIPLTKLEAAVCSEDEAKGFVTKELFIPATYGTDSTFFGGFATYQISAAASQAFISFVVPQDFVGITEGVIVRIARAAGTHRLNYYATYGAVGELYDAQSESLLDQDTVEVFETIYEQDISAALSVLAAGDYVGVQIVGDAVNIPDDHILGMRLKYA